MQIFGLLGIFGNETKFGDGEDHADLPTMVDSFERELIVAALKRSPGNMSAAARELGISPRVLHYKMHRLGLQKS